jgi:predicted dehydrogenase
MGEIDSVIGVSDYPWTIHEGESLAHTLLKFENGKIGVYHCHKNEIPMETMPFFQIFGTKVSLQHI